jgi:hypothetical protein
VFSKPPDSSAITDVERAGYRVSKVELARAAIPG